MANIISAQKDKDDYEAILSDGTLIEFNKQGEWTDAAINEISKERRGYDVDLTSGINLIFSADGTFIALD